MVLYQFKQIQVVPAAKDFVDIVLSKTQRKTPTVVHPGYSIGRIRQFYMRKVKYTQQSYHDKLSKIIQDFPVLDDIHPFYADLINVLYDKDHYKLALGQINTARNLVDNLSKDYVRMLKYADSLYRCKQLKRAALGRMCTLLRKLGPSLAYLEQVRQHLARLPSIDPSARTLLVCGFPNVGKSSFMNRLTHANVDVQPYAFTTKSLFVGHMDYRFVRWQVVDTPGILDHALDERNTIEMTAITALAHLRAAVLFVLDISEQCGHTIAEQVALFHNIKPLFAHKPLVVALNKIDVVRPDQLAEQDQELLRSLADATRGGVTNMPLVPMSTLTDEGVGALKETACDLLLQERVEKKLRQTGGRLASNFNRLHLALPAPRDNKTRAPSIPDSVIRERAEGKKGMEDDDDPRMRLTKGQLEVMQQLLDAERLQSGQDPSWLNNVDFQKLYQLRSEDYNLDIVPEIYDGMNIIDWVDPDIEERLDELEREEEERQAALALEPVEEVEELDDEQLELVGKIRDRKRTIQSTKAIVTTPVPRAARARHATAEDFGKHLQDNLGLDAETTSDAVDRARERSSSRGRKRMRIEGAEVAAPRSTSRTPAADGLKNVEQQQEALKMKHRAFKQIAKNARKGEGDRTILIDRPKHLFAGKRTVGKTQYR